MSHWRSRCGIVEVGMVHLAGQVSTRVLGPENVWEDRQVVVGSAA